LIQEISKHAPDIYEKVRADELQFREPRKPYFRKAQ